jgi:hypothetical protein
MVEFKFDDTVLLDGILHLCGVLDLIGGEEELAVLIQIPLEPTGLSGPQHKHITYVLIVDIDLDTEM